MKDLKLKDDDIISLIKPLQEKAEDWYDDLREEREVCRKLYDREKFGNERNSFSKYVSAIVWDTVEWLKPGIVSIFTSPDFFDIRHKDDALARRVKNAVRYQLFRKNPGEKELRAFIHDSLVYHFGVAKVCYREIMDQETEKYERLSQEEFSMLQSDPGVTISKYDEVQEIIEQVVPDAMGMPVTMEIPSMTFEKVKAVRRITKYAGPMLECIPGHEFRMVQAKSIDDSPLVAHVKKKTLDEIKRGELTGQYLKGSYDKLKDKIHSLTVSSSRNDEDRIALYGADGLTLQDEDITSFREDEKELNPLLKVEVWESYTKLDIDGDGLLEHCIISNCGDIVLQKQENPYGGPTMLPGRIFEIPHRFEGRPMPKVLENDQKEITNLRRIFVDASAESTYSTMVTNDPGFATKWGHRKVGQAIIAMNPEKMTELRPRPPGRTALDAMEKMRIDAERSVGVNSLNQGIDDNSYGKTATGTMALQNAGQQKQRFYVSVLADAMEDIIRRFIEINKKWPPTSLFDETNPESPRPGDFENLDDYSIEIRVGVGPQDRASQVQALQMHQDKLIKVFVPQGLAGPEHVLACEEKIGQLLEVPFTNLQFSAEQFNTVQQLQQQLQQASAQAQQVGAQLQQAQGALNAERQQRAAERGGQIPPGFGAMGKPVFPGGPGPGPGGIPGGNPNVIPFPGSGVPGLPNMPPTN
jgi:hypothetical protein